MQNLTGQTIGRYHIIEKLGEGGMAVVYKAFDTILDCDVAVKVIRIEDLPPSSAERTLKRFTREAKEMANLLHPNIVQVKDYGEFDGTPYLVMPFVPGGTLKDRLEKTGQVLSYSQAAKILAPVARALEYAHQKGIIHRDIKPGNILITESGQPLLTDFGVAKILDLEHTTQLTGVGMAVGTPEYMAPEQWMGKVIPQIDIYSLGIVFFELITGRLPYTADTPAAVMLKQATEPLPRPRELVQGLPEKVEQVIYKVLARNESDRYADMGSFAAALERLAEDNSEPVSVLESNRQANKINLPAEDLGTSEELVTGYTGLKEIQKRKQTQSRVGKPKTMVWLVGLGCLAILGVIAFYIFTNLPPTIPSTQTPVDTGQAKPEMANTNTVEPKIAKVEKTPQTGTGTELGIGKTLTREKDGMVMVFVPKGKFVMGRDNGGSDEKPQHLVNLDAYWIDKTEVTNTEYEKCVAEGICLASVFKNDSNFNSPNQPVVGMDWDQAQAYCKWAGGRLPTEAEWEKAARGLDGRTYPWGNDALGNDLLNNSEVVGKTSDVGSYPGGASPYGALDMSGNVWEWTEDLYNKSFYAQSPENNPIGKAVCSNCRVRRGGSWSDDYTFVTTTNRGWAYQTGLNANNVGFRCVQSGISNDQNPEISSKVAGNENAAGNTSNGGKAVASGEWLYYTYGSDGGNLYKMHLDGSGNQKISDDYGRSLWLENGVIYYSMFDGATKLKSIRVDGSSPKILSEKSPQYINVYGDWIYFSNKNDGGKIYRIHTDGTDLQKLNEDRSTYITVFDNFIYFSNENDGARAYRANLDGSGQQKLNFDKSQYLNVIKDWIYYINDESDGMIYRMHLDGSGIERITTDYSSSLNIYQDWVYYQNSLDNKKIYKMRLDGSERQKINDDNSTYINVAGGWIFYLNYSESGNLYRMKLDGSERVRVNK